MIFEQELSEQELSSIYKTKLILNPHIDGNNPNSLVLTIPLRQHLKLLSSAKYFWIDSGAQQNQEKKRIQKQAGLELICFRTAQDAKKELESKNYKKVYIISSFSLAQAVQKQFGQQKVVKNIICYCLNINGYNECKQKQLLPSFTFGTNNQDRLIKQLDNIKINTSDVNKNFISIDSQTAKSNRMCRTINAMVNQRTNQPQLIDQMIQLLRETSVGIKNQYLQTFKNDVLSDQKIIQYYTSNKNIFSLVNSLLRSWKHPAQIYCIQPYFKKLFLSIKKLYKENGQMKNIRCYRGAKVNKKELNFFKKNKGKHIQNMFFMSTSTNRKVAQSFISNALIIIDVKSNSSTSSGYADIKKSSYFQHEQEILFNPLNFFLIQEFREQNINGKKVNVIELIYGFEDTNLSILKEYQKKMAGVQTYGDILVCQQLNLYSGKQYWKQYLAHAVEIKDKLKGYRKLGQLCINNGLYAEAIDCFENQFRIILKNNLNYQQLAINKNNLGDAYLKSQNYQKSLFYFEEQAQLKKNLFGQQSLKYADALNNLGSVYRKLNNTQKSLELYQKSLRITQVNGNNQVEFAYTANNIANIYIEIGNYQKSMQYFLQSQEIFKKTIGQVHPSYADILNNMGVIYLMLDQNNIAIEKFQQALQLKKKMYRPQHPSIKDTEQNIKLACESQRVPSQIKIESLSLLRLSQIKSKVNEQI